MSDNTARADALDLAAAILRSGLPIHPRMKRRIQDAIGELTEEENAMLGAYRRAGEADA